MSKLILILLVFYSSNSFYQSYHKVDEKIQNYPQFKSINDLGIRIQNNFSSDINRIRAAFSWVARNIYYNETLEEVFQPKKRLAYHSKSDKQKAIRKIELGKINRAFQNKKGVCEDFSLILNELLTQFGIPNKVILGIIKTDIKDVKGKHLLKNHAWNAVYIDDHWELMDVTLASGYWSIQAKKFIRSFNEYYFFTSPQEFIKVHYPANPKWQLSNNLVDVETFYNEPIYYPAYFINNVKLKKSTKGTFLISSTKELIVSFDHLPNKHELYFQFENDPFLKKAKIQRGKNKGFTSKIKVDKHFKDNEYVTLYLQNEAILDFKVEKINQ